MEREILFRGKRVDTGEWVEGSLLSINNKTEQKSFRFIIPELSNGSHVGNIMKFVNPCFKVLLETVGQFTGLLDKNGKKIFEGDLVVWLNQKCLVSYKRGRYVAIGQHPDKYERHYAPFHELMLDGTLEGLEGSLFDGVTTRVEKIGTIHDQPKSEG